MTAKKKKWICAFCNGPMSRNLHPNAGEPKVLLAVGSIYVCIPCTVRSRHRWSRRALRAERRVEELEEEVKALRERLSITERAYAIEKSESRLGERRREIKEGR